MAEQRKWINFARYTSPPIGKARQIEIEQYDTPLPSIWMKILMDDGHEYEGFLKQVKEDEEE